MSDSLNFNIIVITTPHFIILRLSIVVSVHAYIHQNFDCGSIINAVVRMSKNKTRRMKT